MSALWTIAVTDQKVRLLSDGAGYAWVEEWRGDELVAVCFAEDLHPERFAHFGERNPHRVNDSLADELCLPWARFFG